MASACGAAPQAAELSPGHAQSRQRAPFGGLPHEWIEFSAAGELATATPVLPLDETITDFIVVSHGWNTDYPGAANFYEPLLRGIGETLSNVSNTRRYAALLVLWPSKEYGASLEAPATATVSDRRMLRATDVGDDVVRHFVNQFAAFTGADRERLMERAQVAIAESFASPASAALVGEMLEALGWQEQLDAELASETARFAPENAQALLRQLSGERRLRFDGAAREQRSQHQGPRTGVSLIFNSFTFWGMKERAGRIGRGLAAHVLAPLQASSAARIHLIGHSFGARVVTSAAHHAEAARLQSLTLLQGAFSQNALARGGAFEGAHRKVAGPTVITHTHNDDAVYRLYAIASHLSGDSSRRLGGPDDPFGAIGANGAQGIADYLAMPAPACLTDPIRWSAGKVHNLNSDACIANHMDVRNERITRIAASAMAV